MPPASLARQQRKAMLKRVVKAMPITAQMRMQVEATLRATTPMLVPTTPQLKMLLRVLESITTRPLQRTDVAQY